LNPQRRAECGPGKTVEEKLERVGLNAARLASGDARRIAATASTANEHYENGIESIGNSGSGGSGFCDERQSSSAAKYQLQFDAVRSNRYRRSRSASQHPGYH